MEQITSTANPTVKYIKSLQQRKFREETGTFFVEGFRFSQEALRSGWEIKQILVTEAFWQEQRDTPLLQGFSHLCVTVSEKVMKELSETEHPQGILTVVAMPQRDYLASQDILAAPYDSLPYGLSQDATRLVVLDCLQDPGNMGTVIRTADAFDFDGVLACQGCVDIYNGKVLRATMGSIFHLPVLQTEGTLETVNRLKQAGYTVYATHLQGTLMSELPLPSPEEKIALIIGNEGRGIAPEVARAADRLVKIPMPGKAESLNASVAAGIFLYTLRKE